jgi:hypothetical protein
MTWGTNDTTAWQQIASEFDKKLWLNSEYVQEINEKKRKPIILQIADTDVSENWVEYLQKIFLKYLWDPNRVTTLPMKRIILWQELQQEISLEEYLEQKKNNNIWNWDPVFLPNGRVQLKQIGVKRKQDILAQIMSLFENFFDDINY